MKARAARAHARLAAWLASVPPSAVGDAVRARAGAVFADTVACMAGGLASAEVARLECAVRGPGPREPFTGVTATPGDIALLLGFGGAALELDEGHYVAGGHPAVHSAAAVLAEAARGAFDEADRLHAFLVGYEAGARIGAATALRSSVHPHGTWGAVGAAVGVARLRRFDAPRMAEVIDVAASLGLATSARAPLAGGSVRSAWVGAAARNGLLACDLVSAGATGEPDGCASVFGEVLGTRFDSTTLHEGLGERYFVSDNFMKRDASCRETHGALAAVEKACGTHRPVASAVREVLVETFAAAARLSDAAPVNETAARFSIPASVAAWIVEGRVRADAFGDGRLRHSTLRDLMRRVSVVAVPEAEAALPQRRLCRCRIELADGTVLDGEVDAAPGDPCRPLPKAALLGKFDELHAMAAGGAARDGLVRSLRRHVESYG